MINNRVAHMLVIFLSIWLPFTVYWAQQPSDSWLTSPLWNSWYLLLIGAVVLVGYFNRDHSVHMASLVMLCVYAISRSIYGTQPEYWLITPLIDFAAAIACVFYRQRVIAGIFGLMLIHFVFAKVTGLPAWRWQMRNNLLWMIQCFVAVGMWSYPMLRSRFRRRDKPPSDSALKFAVDKGAAWPRMQSGV